MAAQSWRRCGYWLLAGVGLVGSWGGVGTTAKAILVLALIWFWLAILGRKSKRDPALTHDALLHFSTAWSAFIWGFLPGAARNLGLFWCGLLVGFGLVLVSGLRQHFGGWRKPEITSTLYIYPDKKDVIPPEYLKRWLNRIFGTLFIQSLGGGHPDALR